MKKMLILYFVLVLSFGAKTQNKENLPIFNKNVGSIQKDWLVDQPDAKAQLYKTADGNLVFSNGLVSRTFTTKPNCATVSFDLLTNNESFLRSVRPEAEVTIDGNTFAVGGLVGQPIHNYLLPEWISQMTADPASFKLKDFRVEGTKARFPWKKRLAWMPKDMPWPAPGKELIFTYRLDDNAISLLSAKSMTDANRLVMFQDNFEKLNKEWVRFESKADARNSFINEGKSGEIMALSNTAVFADQKVKVEARVFIARINPGTDQSVSWGPGLGLVFKNRIVKVNLRPKNNQIGFYDGEHEQRNSQVKGNTPVWLRLELTKNELLASYSYNMQEWFRAGKTNLTKDEKPELVRVGKMDWAGGKTDNSDKGEQGRCHIEQFQMLGDIPADAKSANAAKYDYLKDIEVNVHYELYDQMPVFSKWVTVENKSSKSILLDKFKSEILAVVEPESIVDGPVNSINPNITVETDYNFNGMSGKSIFESSVAWNIDPLYKTQVNYERTTPCLLEVYPKYGPAQDISSGETFSTYRTWELLHDSWDRERKGLEHRRMMRAMAPWVTENPILMHVRSAQTEAVKNAVDQCAEVGFEKVIMTFGSGFNTEDTTPKNIDWMKMLADYAHSKGITLGGYSLLASRSIDKENDVVMPEGKTPRFGNSPCIESEWGQKYFEQLYNFYEKTGLDIFEHDGSYPGDICASTIHPGHKGLDDSQWNQYKRITDFYKWCRSKGIYLNVPDYYFLSGSNKTAMGYRETNWSLPREQQEIVERQNIFDGTWDKSPSMGWMFVPLVQYHGGGEAATIEPLKDHLSHYGQRLANLFGAGVQACYRGPQLYDTPETKAVVSKWVSFYKMHRQILDADIIHIRRPDGRDYDAILHVDPQGKEKGLLMIYNPLNEPINRKIRINLYYTGLKNQAKITDEKGVSGVLKIDNDHQAWIDIEIPAKSQVWYIFTE
jgi:hypothetical protein